MYLVHIYAYPYKYTYIQVLMAQNSCISQPYKLQLWGDFEYMPEMIQGVTLRENLPETVPASQSALEQPETDVNLET